MKLLKKDWERVRTEVLAEERAHLLGLEMSQALLKNIERNLKEFK